MGLGRVLIVDDDRNLLEVLKTRVESAGYEVTVAEKESEALEAAGMTANKNTIPKDPASPFYPSGVRLGTPAITTRGMKEPEMRVIAKWIVSALEHRDDAARLAKIRGEVLEMAQRFPLYGWLRA